MLNNLSLHLENFELIKNANLELGKINIVSGPNSTGKSTLSKLLYCFLKSNSSKRQEFTFESIEHEIKRLKSTIEFYAYNLDADNKELIQKFNSIEETLNTNTSLNSKINSYNSLKEIFYNLNLSKPVKDNINEDILKIDKTIRIIIENKTPLYITSMETLLESEFLKNSFTGFFSIKNKTFNYSINFDNNRFECDGLFMLDDVYYIDSFSTLDLFQIYGLNTSNHAGCLVESLKEPSDESKKFFDKEFNDSIISLESRINELINGKLVYSNNELYYVPEKGTACVMRNTASGIKQIGILLLLLSNRKLKKNSFLIIDEPEVNLHPDWQVRFAEVIAATVRYLNIHVYINTHSPVLIEAINVYAQCEGLNDDTTYYLTHEDGSFEMIKNNELYKIYRNLGQVYDDLDILRLENR